MDWHPCLQSTDWTPSGRRTHGTVMAKVIAFSQKSFSISAMYVIKKSRLRSRGSPKSDLNAPLRKFLTRRLPPSHSSVKLVHRETTVCYAYMCQYAYACTEKSSRPAKVLERRCMRYQPEAMRVEPQMSDFALDMLARRRDAGESLETATVAVLEKLRPNGPTRRST